MQTKLLPLPGQTGFGLLSTLGLALLGLPARAGAGATPAAALMFTCAGRGKGLFGVADVDAKALRFDRGASPRVERAALPADYRGGVPVPSGTP